MCGLRVRVDDKQDFSSTLLKIELRYAALQMPGECLISKTELTRLADERRDAHSKLCTNTEANRRQNSALHNYVSNPHRSSLANPLCFCAHEEAREDVISE